jgi:hypothetical protein
VTRCHPRVFCASDRISVSTRVNRRQIVQT